MLYNLGYREALDKADHLKALGQTTVYLHTDEGFPFGDVISVEKGNSYRLNGPSSCCLTAEKDGLTFKLSVNFEPRAAEGKGTSYFDRERLRDLMVRLSPKGRKDFADMLEREVLPGLLSRTADVRAALNAQLDSEECVRGLIEFGASA